MLLRRGGGILYAVRKDSSTTALLPENWEKRWWLSGESHDALPGPQSAVLNWFVLPGGRIPLQFSSPAEFHLVGQPSQPRRMRAKDIADFAAFFRGALPFYKADQLLLGLWIRYGCLPPFDLDSESVEESKQCCNFVLHSY